MSLLVVGSIAIDSVETPAGRADDVVGGAAIYFAYAASFFTPVRMVAAVGDDFPADVLDDLGRRGVDLGGVEQRAGKTLRWSGRYHEDMNVRDTLAPRPRRVRGLPADPAGRVSRLAVRVPRQHRSAPAGGASSIS